MTLPVLSFWQPWGTLVVAIDPMWNAAAKGAETRGWKPFVPLPFTAAVHAAKRYDAQNRGQFTEAPFGATLKRCGFYPGDPRQLLKLDRTINGLKPVPLGAIIGTVEVFDVITAQEWIESRHSYDFWEEGERYDQEKAFGFYGPGRYAWLLRNPRMLASPIPFSGRQEALYQLDATTQAKVDAQLGVAA